MAQSGAALFAGRGGVLVAHSATLSESLRNDCEKRCERGEHSETTAGKIPRMRSIFSRGPSGGDSIGNFHAWYPASKKKNMKSHIASMKCQ